MNQKTAPWAMILALLTFVPAARSQDQTPPKPAAKQARPSPGADTQKKNIEAYVDLLRSDVRQQKAEIMGSVMRLSAADSAKFWPVYSEYDTELAKLNDDRAAAIEEYVRTYTQMTDEKADELIHKAIAYDARRAELLAKYYDRVKQELGAITAARFIQVEHQLLSIIDLRLASSLPTVGEGS